MDDQLSQLGTNSELGPIQKFLEDPDVVEIYINGYRNVYIRKRGRRWELEQVESEFADNDAVYTMLTVLLKNFDAVIDEKHPIVNIRVEDGTRIFAVIYPVSLIGPSLTIRKFPTNFLSVEKLIQFGTMTVEMAQFIQSCVVGKFNIIVSGGVGSGKNTLMNVCSGFMKQTDRIVSIERQAEFQLRQHHVVTLESHTPDADGQGGVSVKDLVLASPELHADYILLGELEGEEVLEALRLADRGQTVIALCYASSPQDVLDRLEMLVKLDRPTLPPQYIRSLMASAISVIIHQERLEDGTRKITHISLIYASGNECKVQDIFTFMRTGFENGKILGRFTCQPVTMDFYQRMAAQELRLHPDLIPEGANQ